MGEFDLIASYFTPRTYAPDVLLGVGDDAAVLAMPPEHRLVTAVDTIVAGVHFPLDTAPAAIAYRALAVNLSDLAAMGAVPRWFTLSLCMPQASPDWLAEFATCLHELAAQHGVQLVGGDTVKGPLNISIQVLGTVETDGWLTRSGANVNDVVFISAIPGEAAGGLQLLLDPALAAAPAQRANLLERFHYPTPRLELGRRIRKLASAAMDVSDGLLNDLNKLCKASHCGAQLDLDALPKSSTLQEIFGAERAEQLALQGGDDYELLFTVPHEKLLQLEAVLADLAIRCTPIGKMVSGHQVTCLRRGEAVTISEQGFDHFSTAG